MYNDYTCTCSSIIRFLAEYIQFTMCVELMLYPPLSSSSLLAYHNSQILLCPNMLESFQGSVEIH